MRAAVVDLIGSPFFVLFHLSDQFAVQFPYIMRCQGAFIFLVVISFNVIAQEAAEDSVKSEPGKNGWTFGALPVISYDTDIGLQYGALVELFNYGDGQSYPEYHHRIYLEWSRTTKGSGVNRLYFDSERTIPGIRLTADVSYLTEQTMQFFGFNGYDAVYNASWEDDTSPDYVSRVFYRHDRRMFRVLTSFQGQLLKTSDRFRWIAGFTFHDNAISSVDIDKLNEGKESDEQLPDTLGLYDHYVSWGAISENEAAGNRVTYLKAGLVYDTRNEEAFPTKGIWADAILSYSPTFLGDWDYSFTKFTLAYRQYLGFGSRNFVVAYRIGYQGTLSGKVPFHMQPHIVPAIMLGASSEGLGGSRSLRGVMRNRVVGDGIMLGNVELRWRFLQTIVMKQKIYIGTNVFTDFGQVVKKIDFELNPDSIAGVNLAEYFDTGTEAIHFTTGIGLKFGLNDNFILSIDHGIATDSREGNSGTYINMNWVF